MADSADIRSAAERLNQALQGLEKSLIPMLENYSRLEKTAIESESLAEDRTRLAQELDQSKAREDLFKSREEDFNRLAGETTAELDQVISKVRTVLERD